MLRDFDEAEEARRRENDYDRQVTALTSERDAARDDARRLRNQLSGSRACLKTYMAHYHVSEDSPLRQLMVLLDDTSYREGK